MPRPSEMAPAICPCRSLFAGAGGVGGAGRAGVWAEADPGPDHQVAPGGAIVWRSCDIGPVPATPSGADNGGGAGSASDAAWAAGGAGGIPWEGCGRGGAWEGWRAVGVWGLGAALGWAARRGPRRSRAA